MPKSLPHQPWKLIIILALINLVRPILSILGLYDGLKPAGPIIITILIALSWIIIAIKTRLADPVSTLALAATTYGVFAILLPVIIGLIAPQLNPEIIPIPGMVAVLVTNAVWGTLLGLVARLILKHRSQPHT
jgi:hypothetical protein